MLSALLVTLGDPNTLTGGYLFHRRLAELAPRHAARLEFLSAPDRPFPFGVADGPRVLRDLRRARPDVAVLDSIAAASLGPWLRARDPGVPFVGMLHQPPGGIDHGPPRQTVQAWLDRMAYPRLQRLLVASDALGADLRRDGQPAGKIFVVPPGRDVASATGAPVSDVRAGRKIALLSVGNWVARKGVLDVLAALADLPEQTATLHLVGATDVEPAYAARVWARVRQPDLRERVIVHGPLPRGDVAAWYSAADAFVLPSRKEPFGTVYGEAMAFGLPVVGWRAGNLPHLAEHEREGLLVEPDDIAGLRAALARLADDPALRQRLGEAARVRALSRPTWDQTARVFFDHLRQVRSSA